MKLLIFKNENRDYSVELRFVKSIHGTDVIRENGHQSPVLQVNGHIIPLISLSSFISGKKGLDATSGKIMLFESQLCSFAVKVDQIERIISAKEDQIESMPPVFRGFSQSCFPCVLKQDDSMILMIRPDGIARKMFPDMFGDEYDSDMSRFLRTESWKSIRIPEIDGNDQNEDVPYRDIRTPSEPIQTDQTESEEDDVILLTEEIEISDQIHSHAQTSDDPEQVLIAPDSEYRDSRNKEEALEKFLIQLFRENRMEHRLQKIVSGIFQESVVRNMETIKQSLTDKSPYAAKHP
jgi:chemotaxis signal transduction protein